LFWIVTLDIGAGHEFGGLYHSHLWLFVSLVPLLI